MNGGWQFGKVAVMIMLKTQAVSKVTYIMVNGSYNHFMRYYMIIIFDPST